MATYSALDLIRRVSHIGEFGDGVMPHGEVTPTAAPVTADLLRPLKIPAGFRMYALLLSWASQGATAPCDWGYTPVDTNEGSLAAAPTAFTAALAMAAANTGTWLAGFNEIKFEQDAFLLGTFGTVVTGAAGIVRATCFGISEGVK